jgi:hypothetical protein
MTHKAIIHVFVWGSSAVALLQATPPSELVGPVERLSLEAALIFAVIALWKVTREQSQIIQSLAVKVAENVAQNTDANKELRKSTEELGAAIDNISENFAALASAIERK